jgi:hypothetical protein
LGRAHEFMQRHSVPLHGTLGSCLRDALHESGAAALLPISLPRGRTFLCLPFFPPSVLLDFIAFFVIIYVIYYLLNKSYIYLLYTPTVADTLRYWVRRAEGHRGAVPELNTVILYLVLAK